MYVIVDIQGQQFKVEQNQKLYIHHIPGNIGERILLDKILLVVDSEQKVIIGTPFVKNVKLECEIIQSLVKGDKVFIFHKKRRKGYRKLNGHRQQFSLIEIKSIQI